MARKRDPRRDEAFKMFENANGSITNKEIAEVLSVPEKTISAWKSRDKWNAVLQNGECSTAKNDCSTTNKVGAPAGNKNALGASGNNRASPPRGNQNAFKHGLFAKHMPNESLEIAQELNNSDPAEIIWTNIMIQYTAIIRAQKIMFVESKEDLSKEVSGWSSGAEGGSESYDVQYAWDKQANFLAAQSRAMSTLSSLIKQFVLIADELDERRQKLELMQLSVEKTKSEIRRLKIINGEFAQEDIGDDGFVDAIKGIANDPEVWSDDDIET